ncbi:corA protein [Flavobacterium enshiense DK69]|uniref:Magnesium transport protein CorA n=1 Tax=Flavobacterium enshiense DK69 TaxID=1107311 RepID=V6SDM0_9FLAO|nr:magnesium/cobalt transporter CorA [Flavobacterium enshiense]ESU24773.1 corA protein [Flavobacterium enshiense DK69]KGO96774.1 magnesium transporter [Flavobacterium enshiense DK69]
MRKIKYKKGRKTQPNFYEYTGVHRTHPVEMQLFVYDENRYEEYQKVQLKKVDDELKDKRQVNDVKWLNIHGLHDLELIKNVGNLLQVEPYIIGDILNTTRRTKMEELNDTLFFSIKSILPEEDLYSVRVEQISFILKENLLVSFQEKKSDFFTHIRERIRTNSGIVCKKKNDYLLYLLLDAVMENFYITIENYEDRIEALMVESKTNHRQDVLIRIENNRENLNFLKRSIVPLRDALFSLKSFKDDTDYDGIEVANYTFFARLHQKCLELLEQIDYDLNSLDSASHFHFSAQSQRMNEIMKTLTVVSVVFIPLTFIVGVYGMNFDYMPELRWQNGYFLVLFFMLLIVVGMVFYFKKKRWF